MGRLCIVVLLVLPVLPVSAQPNQWQNPLEQQDYLNLPLVEVIPFVFKGELYVLENWRSNWPWPDQPSETAAKNYEMWIAHLPDGPEEYEHRKHLTYAMAGRTLGKVFVWEDRVYVYGVNEASDRTHVDMVWSDDLVNWSEPVKVFDSPAGQIFNVSMVRDDLGFVFLWETNAVGTPFTMCFGRINSLTDSWNTHTIADAQYGVDKYTGGPAIFYEGGMYYLLYLEHLGAGRYETRITRSRDLKQWQDAPQDRPFVTFDTTRRNIPLLEPHLYEINASDPGLAYYNGRVIVYYTGGDQLVAGDLQWATFDGTKQELFERFFEGLEMPGFDRSPR